MSKPPAGSAAPSSTKTTFRKPGCTCGPFASRRPSPRPSIASTPNNGLPENIDDLISVALYEKAHPVKGLELMLKSRGTCNTISAFDQAIAQLSSDERLRGAELLVKPPIRRTVELGRPGHRTPRVPRCFDGAATASARAGDGRELSRVAGRGDRRSRLAIRGRQLPR